MRRVLLIVLLAVLGVAAGIWVLQRKGGTGDLTFAGSIEARDVQVGSLVGGRIDSVFVEEGDSVSAEQILVTIEPDLLDDQIREQQGGVDAARARLALAVKGPRPEEIARARLDWENAERERKRLDDLLSKQFVSQAEYDAAATAAGTKRELLTELERGNRPEDIAAARATLAQAEGRLAYLKRQRGETVVRAPARGLLQSFDLRPGDLVVPNQAVATLLETSQIWVRVYVPEPKLGHVRVGQTASLSVDSFPRRSFAGTVVEISQRAEYTPRNIQTIDQRSEQVFGVKIAIHPAPELKPGMAVVARLSSP
jgi:membrane fusion protein YbhG